MTAEADWRAWKKACAAALCAPGIAATLRRFGAARFAGYTRRAGFPFARATDPWHLFETHCQVGRTRAGKRYKDWLFARADGSPEHWTSIVEGGASLLMRSAVREFLRREYAPPFATSIDKPAGNTALSLVDLLPDPAAAHPSMEEAELDLLTGRLADTISMSLSKADLALLWARTHGISFADPQVLKLTRLGKSVLYERFQRVIEVIVQEVDREYHREDVAVRRDLLLGTVKKLGAHAGEKLFPGKPAWSLL